MRNLDGRMMGRTTGRMDGKEDRRTDGHHGYYYVGDKRWVHTKIWIDQFVFDDVS